MSASKSKEYALKPFKAPGKKGSTDKVPTSKEFLDNPASPIVFEGQSFCFTGVFAYANGDRNQCEAAVRARGGYCFDRPSRDLNYLVVGSFEEPAWSNKTYGRKIETALALKTSGSRCQIISEEHFLQHLNATSELPAEKQTPLQEESRSYQLLKFQQKTQRQRQVIQLLANLIPTKSSSSAGETPGV